MRPVISTTAANVVPLANVMRFALALEEVKNWLVSAYHSAPSAGVKMRGAKVGDKKRIVSTAFAVRLDRFALS
jgi:hypothetical protein